MKYLFSLALLPFLSGCVLEYNPHPVNPTNKPHSVAWNAKGDKIFVLVDSFTNNGYIRAYDASGAGYRSFQAPEDMMGGYRFWGTSDSASVFYFSSSYSTKRFDLTSTSTTSIAGGSIFGQSPNRTKLFIGPYYTYQNSGVDDLLIVDVSGEKPRLVKSWYDAVAEAYEEEDGTWIGGEHLGYFRYNDLNLIDFIIRDTLGAKLDSFDINFMTSYATRIAYAQGSFYFTSSRDSLMLLDSAMKTSSAIAGNATDLDAAPDGTFIVFASNNSLFVRNALTGVVKKIADNSYGPLKISPQSNRLAYIDNSGEPNYKLVVIPVAAP